MAKVEAGKTYLGFICEKCGQGIPLVEDDPSNPTVGITDTFGVFRLQCLRCKYEADYRPDAIQRLTALLKQ